MKKKRFLTYIIMAAGVLCLGGTGYLFGKDVFEYRQAKYETEVMGYAWADSSSAVGSKEEAYPVSDTLIAEGSIEAPSPSSVTIQTSSEEILPGETAFSDAQEGYMTEDGSARGDNGGEAVMEEFIEESMPESEEYTEPSVETTETLEASEPETTTDSMPEQEPSTEEESAAESTEESIVPSQEPESSQPESIEPSQEPESTEPSQEVPGDKPEEGVLLAQNPYLSKFQENPDMIAWIKIEGFTVDYPVMWTPEDETFYINKNFKKQKDSNGCLILDKDSSVDPMTTNLIIHGHNMKSGAMFGYLGYYKTASYRKKHPYIDLYTRDQHYRYEIMAIFNSQIYKKDEDIFKFYEFFQADTKEEFDDFYNNVMELALYDSGVTAEYGDKFITLSTCTYQVKNGRLVLVAKQIPCDEEPYDTSQMPKVERPGATETAEIDSEYDDVPDTGWYLGNFFYSCLEFFNVVE